MPVWLRGFVNLLDQAGISFRRNDFDRISHRQHPGVIRSAAVSYVELLLNSVERCIAIRPCDKNNPNAIRWGRLKEGRWCASTLGCRGLAKTLFDIICLCQKFFMKDREKRTQSIRRIMLRQQNL